MGITNRFTITIEHNGNTYQSAIKQASSKSIVDLQNQIENYISRGGTMRLETEHGVIFVPQEVLRNSVITILEA